MCVCVCVCVCGPAARSLRVSDVLNDVMCERDVLTASTHVSHSSFTDDPEPKNIKLFYNTLMLSTHPQFICIMYLQCYVCMHWVHLPLVCLC